MSEANVLIVREKTAEPDDTGGWTDVRIQGVLDMYEEDTDASAGHIWSVKAADSATYVDISENGSSRKMSDVHKNAVSMSNFYRGLAVDVVAATEGRPHTRAIVRP